VEAVPAIAELIAAVLEPICTLIGFFWFPSDSED
jgi:hypothetical protein